MIALTGFCALLVGAVVQPVAAQEKTAAPTPDKTPASSQNKPPAASQKKSSAPGQENNPTAEQVAESTVYIYGSRGVLEHIRRNGVERGRISRLAADGREEEATYERRFIRGADVAKDKIRVDQKMPTMEYSLVYGDG